MLIVYWKGHHGSIAGLDLPILFQTVPAAIKMRATKQQAEPGKTPRIHIESTAPYGGTLLVKPYERLIKQLDPLSWRGNHWIEHPGSDLPADVFKEKTQPER